LIPGGGGITTSGSKVAQPKTSESIANTAQQSNSTTSAQTNTASSQKTESTTASAETAQSTISSTPASTTASSNTTASSTPQTSTSGASSTAKTDTTTSSSATVSTSSAATNTAKNTSEQYNTSAKTYNDAKQNYETAKSNAQKASDEKDAATKQKEAANKKLADAKQDVSDKTDAVKKAQDDVSTANDTLSKAKKDVDSAKADVAEKQAAFDKAKAAYDEAKAKADEKDNAFSDAQSKLDALQKGSLLEKAQKELTEAQNAEAKAQDTYDSAKTTADNAKDTLAKAKTEKETAANQVTDAQKSADDAKAKVEAAQKALDEAQKNWDEAGRKFIEAHTGIDFDTFIRTYHEAMDPVGDTDYENDSHFDTVLKQALKVETLEKDADMIEECNKLRAANGVDPLLISYSGMQEAALSASRISVAANVYGVFGHVGYMSTNGSTEGCLAFPHLENAAWGLSDHPYVGWYTEEQEYVNFVNAMMGEQPAHTTEKAWSEAECRDFLENTMGWTEQQVNDYFKEVPYGKMTYKQMCNFLNSNELSTKHYAAVIEPEVLRTGIALIDNEYDIYEDSLGYGSTTVQEFYGPTYDHYYVKEKDADGNIINVRKEAQPLETDTPSAFKQKLEDFTKDLKDKLAQAKQALADAQAAQAKATEKLTAAQTASKAADQAYTDAQAKATAADQAYTNAQDALAKAKANTADKQKAYDDALQADKDHAAAVKAQQQVVETARQEKADAHKALTEAEEAKNTADQNLTAAKQAQAKADKAYTDANTKVSDTTSALNTAKNALDIAKGNQTTAQAEANNAAKTETAKIDAFKNAQGLEKEAYDAYKKSGDDLVDFVNTHINALPATDSLTLNDRDDVDTMSKIVDAIPSELKDSLDSDSLAKLDSAKQKIADLILIQKDKDAAKAVADKVNALPETITADNASSVYDAQKAYNKLSDRQKDYAGQEVKDKIEAAVKEADKAMADKVNDAINNLPDNITLNDKDAVKAARDAYNALTPEAKAQVDTTRLTAAEKAIQKLEKQKADSDAAKKVDTMINALPKHPSAKDRAGIMNVYRRYQALSDSAKAMLPEGDVARLLAAMKAANAANIAGTNGNAASAKTITGTAAGSPKTGDNTAAGAEAAALLAAIAGLGVAKRRRRRESEEDA
jgi:hypothetical protein